MKHFVEDIENTSEEDIQKVYESSQRLVEICNLVRERIEVHPSQSNFRVAAVFVVQHKITNEQNEKTTRISFVCGSNAEQGYIGGAICAERATLCRLRFYDDAKIMKVIVTTDSEHAIAPGGLCREFLMSATSPDTPVIAGNAQSTKIVECLLGELWPYPYVYRYCLRCDLMKCAEEFSWKSLNNQDVAFNDTSLESGTDLQKLTVVNLNDAKNHSLAELIAAAKSVNYNDGCDHIHPLRMSGAVLFSDGHIETSWQWKALEYGCTSDPVCQLLTTMKKYTSPQQSDLVENSEINEKAVVQCLVMLDQFGVCHAPFAAARSLLIEHGFQDVQILVHSSEGKLVVSSVKELFPTSEEFGANISHDDFH